MMMMMIEGSERFEERAVFVKKLRRSLMNFVDQVVVVVVVVVGVGVDGGSLMMGHF